MERTLSIIKPDAVQKGVIGPIIKLLEEGGLKVVGAKMLRLGRKQAEGFYAVHKERPFFGSLCQCQGFFCTEPVDLCSTDLLARRVRSAQVFQFLGRAHKLLLGFRDHGQFSSRQVDKSLGTRQFRGRRVLDLRDNLGYGATKHPAQPPCLGKSVCLRDVPGALVAFRASVIQDRTSPAQ